MRIPEWKPGHVRARIGRNMIVQYQLAKGERVVENDPLRIDSNGYARKADYFLRDTHVGRAIEDAGA